MNLARAHTDAVRAIVSEAVSSAAALPSTDAVQARVVSVDASSRATVTWGGATFGAKRLDTYVSPAVGDQVLLLLAGPSPVILGRII